MKKEMRIALIEQYVKHYRIVENMNNFTGGDFDGFPNFDPILDLFGLYETFKGSGDNIYELFMAIFVNDKGYKSEVWAESIYRQLTAIQELLEPKPELKQQQLN